MIARINHVQITIPVGDEETARAFYCGVLGLREIAKPESLRQNGGFWLDVGEIQLHIGVENHDHRSSTKAHVAYQVKNLNQWRERFQGLGLLVKENTPVLGVDRFDSRDPFGNRIELMEVMEHP
ncbi:MAG: VOC family protein [Chloroflexota bacterium]